MFRYLAAGTLLALALWTPAAVAAKAPQYRQLIQQARSRLGQRDVRGDSVKLLLNRAHYAAKRYFRGKPARSIKPVERELATLRAASDIRSAQGLLEYRDGTLRESALRDLNNARTEARKEGVKLGAVLATLGLSKGAWRNLRRRARYKSQRKGLPSDTLQDINSAREHMKIVGKRRGATQLKLALDRARRDGHQLPAYMQRWEKSLERMDARERLGHAESSLRRGDIRWAQRSLDFAIQAYAKLGMRLPQRVETFKRTINVMQPGTYPGVPEGPVLRSLASSQAKPKQAR